MTVREAINDRDASKSLHVKAMGETLYNSKHHSYDRLKQYLECEVIESYEGATVFGLNIKPKEREF